MFFKWEKLNPTNENDDSTITIIANLIFLANTQTPDLIIYWRTKNHKSMEHTKVSLHIIELFFLSNDLHNLQTTQKTNKNIT